MRRRLGILSWWLTVAGFCWMAGWSMWPVFTGVFMAHVLFLPFESWLNLRGRRIQRRSDELKAEREAIERRHAERMANLDLQHAQLVYAARWPGRQIISAEVIEEQS